MISPSGPVQWAQTARLNQIERDCITAIVLKILDGKCKMATGLQEAILVIYDTLEPAVQGLFGDEVHARIALGRSRQQWDMALRQQIHHLRLEAETTIEKATMKSFKARLRRELFEVTT